MELELVETRGLGDNSYLIGSEGVAALVDPQRDVGRLLALAEERGLRITHLLETHVHNDYVSGAFEARRRTGAEIVAPAKANYQYPYRGVDEGDEIRIGRLRLVAMATPGHTPEHTSYLVYDGGDVPVAVFTGGSLMVGGAGRTDLLGEDRTEELTRAQFRTLRRLGALPDTVQVLPTHGAGSFCGAGPSPVERVSTMMEERSRNRALAASDEETFLRQQLSGLSAYPRYYGEMAAINRAGPKPLEDVTRPGPLTPAETERLLAEGVWALDARDRVRFADGHLPGSVNVELGPPFASYVGWVVPFNERLVLVLPEPVGPSLEEAFTSLVRIGYERIEGYLDGGIEAWKAEGRPVRSFPTATIENLCESFRRGEEPKVLDVRQQREWDRGHIPTSRHIFVGDLPGRVAEVPSDEEVWTACASGQRSAIAASLLDRAGVPVRSVVRGGVQDWLKLCPPEDLPSDREP